MLQTLIKRATYVTGEGVFKGDIAVRDGKIVTIGQSIQADAARTIDAADMLIFPGVIDSHVHLPWPSSSFDSVDDFYSGTFSAIHGGVTTIIEYVIPDESGDILPALDQEISKARMNAFVDYSFHLILRKVTERTLVQMAEAVGRGFSSFKIYTAYSGFQLPEREILLALKTAADLKAMVCFHAEDGTLVDFATQRLVENGKTSIAHYPQAHPRLADLLATQRVITYADYFDTRVHIVHINTAEGAGLVEQAKLNGLRVSGETCPHYLYFTEEVYRSGRPEAANYILAPAIREQFDQDSLWQALRSGAISTIASDHCPYSMQQKLQGGDDFRLVPGGAGGIETSLPILYTYGVETGRISLSQLVTILSANPAKLFNLYPRKGILAPGSDADMVIYNPVGTSTIESSQLHSNCDHSIFDGVQVHGKIQATILRGEVVVEGGKLKGKTPQGELLLRGPYPS